MGVSVSSLLFSTTSSSFHLQEAPVLTREPVNPQVLLGAKLTPIAAMNERVCQSSKRMKICKIKYPDTLGFRVKTNTLQRSRRFW